MVGATIHQRFITEGKPGAVQRGAASYSTWFNGGVRTTTGFHNQIGLLSEIIGNPTPISIPFIPARQLPDGSQPFPIQPQQVWHQRQSIEYLLTADRAIMDLASKDREGFLYRSYVMGRNSIERGSKDSWTITPKKIAAVQAAISKEMGAQGQAPSGDFTMQLGGGLRGGVPAKYYDMLHNPAQRDPRGFILPSDQADFLTATRFVNALLKSGVVIHRATAAFQAAGKSYPAGSYVVKTAQAFRPHVMDMFEPQDHPDDIPYPGRRASPAVRRHRVDARLSDGREVRPDHGRVRRPVRADPRRDQDRSGKSRPGEGGGRLRSESPAERRVRRHEPPAGGEGGRVLAEGAADGRCGHLPGRNDLRPRQADDEGQSSRRSPPTSA